MIYYVSFSNQGCFDHGGIRTALASRYDFQTMTLRALLFDLDGTLADTECLGHRPAYNRAFKKLGLSFRWGPKLYRKLLSQPGGQERLLHYLKRYQPELGDHQAAVEADPQAWTRSVHDLKSRYFRRLVRRGRVPLRPGVARLMQEARAAGLRIAIVTSSTRATLRAILQHSLGASLMQEIELMVCGEEVERKKPAPDLYLLALARLDLSARECLAIEDSAAGLAAASAAGVRTVITINDNTAHEQFDRALLVLDTLGEPGLPATAMHGAIEGGHVTVDTLRKLAEPIAPLRAA
ncbi:MAG TPA: HAD-IA family hydrolase [Verrucomicrobiae bacterium]|nr:HAD-IA family hydrolase [Verrucomicrobiae bacterium]